MARWAVALVAGGCLLAAAPALAKASVKTLSIAETADTYQISIRYPGTGNAAIDGEIAAWARQ